MVQRAEEVLRCKFVTVQRAEEVLQCGLVTVQRAEVGCLCGLEMVQRAEVGLLRLREFRSPQRGGLVIAVVLRVLRRISWTRTV